MIKKISLLLLCSMALILGVNGQKVAVKTNLLYGGAALSPNLGVEIGLGKKTTLELTGAYNNWEMDTQKNKKLKHYLLHTEFRYWPCESFNGHFFGVHALGGEFNISDYHIPTSFGGFKKEFRYEGMAVGGGISYGYHWMWSKRWAMEFTAGLGVVHFDYDQYDCAKCGEKIGSKTDTYFGPTKAGISLVFLIK